MSTVPAVVFIGPSLDLTEAVVHLDAEFQPPVRRGDIDALLNRAKPPMAIGIIDGAFLQSLAVSPKEVLHAVDRGVAVFGSSSMGALRAVECGPYGVVGVGQIYDEYQSGRLDADDEVATVYDPETKRALAEPLVNMRFAINAAVSARVTTNEIGQRFLSIAKSLYFPQRTTAAVLRLLASEVGETHVAPLREFLADKAPDAKREDAILLLDKMRTHLASS